MSTMNEEVGVYKDKDGSQHPDTVAMSIVYNLGDALSRELNGKVPARDIVKARQATNDKFIDYSIGLINSLIAQQVREARIDENQMYMKESNRHYYPSSPNDPYIPLVQFHKRIAELEGEK